MAKDQRPTVNYEAGGVAFIGSIITGIGLGVLLGQEIPYSIMGVGVGFVLMAVLGKTHQS